MKIEKIKPIPKYIERLIKKRDLELHPTQEATRRFYAYLTKNDGELTKVTVAVKTYRGKQYLKQVAVHGIHSERCYVNDMAACHMGGFSVGWYNLGIQRQPKWYENGEWSWATDEEFDPYAPVVNKEFLDRFPEYKYSEVKHYKGVRIFRYLRTYERFPQQVETLMKLGLGCFATRITILRQIKKDRPFLRWLIENKDKDLALYYIPTLIRAYQTRLPLDVIQKREHRERLFRIQCDMKPLNAFFKGETIWRLFHYLDTKGISEFSYLDYFNACRHLGLDMNDTKNCFPHDFKRWHDIRIEQSEALYQEERERANRERKIALEKEQQEICKRFPEVAARYHVLQDSERTEYAVFIANSPAELIKEGVALSHCVGGYSYRRKFAFAETLIFFVRHTNAPDVPFVTIEYSISKHCILQCYGESDSRPDDSVLHYVNDIWLPYANAQIKKIKIAA